MHASLASGQEQLSKDRAAQEKRLQEQARELEAARRQVAEGAEELAAAARAAQEAREQAEEVGAGWQAGGRGSQPPCCLGAPCRPTLPTATLAPLQRSALVEALEAAVQAKEAALKKLDEEHGGSLLR